MKLSDLYQRLTVQEREALAKLTGTTPGYLYQLATQWRGKKPSLEMIQALTKADSRLSTAELVDEFLAQAPAKIEQDATGNVGQGV